MAGYGNRRIYQNDVGTEFYLETGSDISTATLAKMFVTKPDNVLVEWVAAAALNPDPDSLTHISGLLTCLRYVFVAGDVSQVGDHKVHGEVTMPGGHWTTNLASFKVYQRFVA